MNKNKRDKTKHDLVKENALTYNDYAALDDLNRYELASGQLEMMSPSPTVTHQMVSFEIQKHFIYNCESDYFILNAPIDVILSPTEVRQPDIVVVNRKRIDILRNRGIEGAPDLVVEILSPSSLKRDKIDKQKVYASYNVPEYWIVEPKLGIIEAYILNEDHYELTNIFQNDEQVTSPNIPCISFTMNEIMDNIPNFPDE